jgi:hypothetical protein
MPVYQLLLAMVLAVYIGFSRLHHLPLLTREPMLTGILKVLPGSYDTTAELPGGDAARNLRPRKNMTDETVPRYSKQMPLRYYDLLQVYMIAFRLTRATPRVRTEGRAL